MRARTDPRRRSPRRSPRNSGATVLRSTASRPGVCGRSNRTVPLCSAARSTPSAGGGPRSGSCAGTGADCPSLPWWGFSSSPVGGPGPDDPRAAACLSRPRPWRSSNAWVVASMLCSEDGCRWSPTASSSARWSGTHRRSSPTVATGRRSHGGPPKSQPSSSTAAELRPPPDLRRASPPIGAHPPVRSPNAPARESPDTGTARRLPGCAGAIPMSAPTRMPLLRRGGKTRRRVRGR
jgi:hypothetical protein